MATGGLRGGSGPVLRGPVLRGPVLRGPVLRGPVLRGAVLWGVALAVLAGCAGSEAPSRAAAGDPVLLPEGALQAKAFAMADAKGLPRALVHRVILRESRYNPAARNGPYMGLMQIHPQTARTMGFRGPAEALLDAETNLRYGLRYLRGAWIVADGDPDRAVMWYARGYYYEARDRGLLEVTGLR